MWKMQIKKRKAEKRPKDWIYFIAPAFILYTVFIIYPIFASVINSFTEWSGLGEKTFVGFDNYIRLFTEPRLSQSFWRALRHNICFVLISYFVGLPVMFFFAYIIDRGVFLGKVYKTVVFLPNVISTAIVGFLAIMVFDPNLGLLNHCLKLIGYSNLTRGWLGDPKIILPAMAGVHLWKIMGFGVILILANMQNIPPDIIEASLIDGAGELKKYFRIILPMLTPSLTTLVILLFIWSISIFDIVYVTLGSTGGAGFSADVLSTFFYRNTFGNVYTRNALGMGTAIAVIMFILMLGVTTVQLKFLTKADKT